MSIARTVKPIRCHYTFTLKEADMTEKKLGEQISSPASNVPCSDGLLWWIKWFPAGDRDIYKDHVTVVLFVNKPVRAVISIGVNGSQAFWTYCHTFTSYLLNVGLCVAPHTTLLPLFRDGKLSLSCTVVFDVLVPFAFLKPSMFIACQHVPTDMELVMESGTVSVHKHFLSMLSPVFHVMFGHDTAESKFGKVKITDFDLETVSVAISFCYGHELKDVPVTVCINLLRFADKYDIKSIFAELEHIPYLNLSIETFFTVTRYAYDCSKNGLLTECAHFFGSYLHQIKSMPEFTDLPTVLVVHLLKTAFGLVSSFDVLRFACQHGCDVVVEFLEKPFLEALSVVDFCPAVSYAWEYSRDELKKTCAMFLSANRVEVTKLKDFHNLSAVAVCGVLKAAYDLENPGE
uniref:BTB domain-containing protein n=1 Tax=Panagrellus redivivus TaxID=6233 RepID=A0A7E4VR71_PANRE